MQSQVININWMKIIRKPSEDIYLDKLCDSCIEEEKPYILEHLLNNKDLEFTYINYNKQKKRLEEYYERKNKRADC